MQMPVNDKRNRNYLLATIVLAGLLAGGSALAPRADDKLPHQKADETWMTITGKVDTVQPNRFSLDYGEGVVTVEMDDRDRDAAGYALMQGDKVLVTGKIDDDTFETTTIEAASVYIERLSTTFVASRQDDEQREPLDATYLPPLEEAQTTLQGTVTDIAETEFTLDSGQRSVRVDIGGLPYNPLEGDGYQKIAVGDRVRVAGQTAVNFFEGREFEAESLVKIYRRPTPS